MCKLLCVTNRTLCTEPFPTRLRRLAESGVDGIILREFGSICIGEVAEKKRRRHKAAKCAQRVVCLRDS